MRGDSLCERLVRIHHAHFAWSSDCALRLWDGGRGCVCAEGSVLLGDLALVCLGIARRWQFVEEAKHACERMQSRE